MTQLPHGFRQIRMELAREKGHPDGARNSGYSFVAPLDSAGRIDAAEWAKHRDSCRVVKFRPDEADEVGHLVRRPGGSWAFRYDITGSPTTMRRAIASSDERFVVGEYVSDPRR